MFSGSKSSGFTLIEALVSVAIFAVVVAMASVLYLATANAQLKATNQEKVMREVRQTMESISRLIRMSSVITSDDSPNELTLDDNNETVRFWLDEDAKQVKYQRGDDLTAYPVTSDDIEITNLEFFISPKPGLSSPGALSSWPTRVTILLTAENAAGAGGRGAGDILKTQTTVVTRREYE